MKSDNLINIYTSKPLDIPKTIELGLLSLYGVDNLLNISPQEKNKIYECHENFFMLEKTTNYDTCYKEYALYYLPVNFYKIWRPLIDLLKKNQIKNICNVLELGSGPGSSTFGLLEFYKHLALENKEITFIIKMDLIEIEKNFINVFKTIFSLYEKDLPRNLKVSINIFNEEVSSFIASNKNKYDLIVESNLFNQNEKIVNVSQEEIANTLSSFLNPKSSIIFIEPAKYILSAPLRNFKSIMHKNGLTIYSPCNCDSVCNQFTLASVNISNIKLIQDMSHNNLIDSKKNKCIHHFEYVVFRNDGLKKYIFNRKAPKNFVKLCDLQDYINKTISFKAYITFFMDRNDPYYSFKICDGSLLTKKNIWLSLPKNIFEHQFSVSNIGRGGIIIVKDAIVKSATSIECTLSSRVTMEM